MPYLAKPKKAKRRVYTNRKERQKVYNSAIWQNLRVAHMMAQPLCEVCKARGIVTAAAEVHHADGFTRYEGDRRLDVAYNPDNLVSVCKQCHAYLHRCGKTSGLNLDFIAAKMDEEFGKNVPPNKILNYEEK